jgi:hypothetical protein
VTDSTPPAVTPVDRCEHNWPTRLDCPVCGPAHILALAAQGITPQSFPSPVGAEDTSSLRERIAAAIAAEDLRMDARSRREPDYDGVEARTEAVMREVESAHGDLVARNAVLRSERDALAHEVERLKQWHADRDEINAGWVRWKDRSIAKENGYRDQLATVLKLWDERGTRPWLEGLVPAAVQEIERLRAELARVSGAHTIPDDAAERKLNEAIRLVSDLVDGEPCRLDHNGNCQEHYSLGYGEYECVDARAKQWLKTLDERATPATDPAPAPAELARWVRWLCDAYGPAEVAAAVRQTDPAPAAADGLARLLWALALTEERFVSEFGTGPSETRDALHEVMRQANAMAAAPQAPAQPPKLCDFCRSGSPDYCSCPPGREDTATPDVHHVEVRESKRFPGLWSATCWTPGCDQADSGTEKEANDWADRHRADTLRPSGPLAPIRHEEE